MISRHLMVGASVLAFAAVTPAFAQTNNTQSGNCSPTTGQGGTVNSGTNSCTTTRGAGADSNNSVINVTGQNNSVAVTQNGVFSQSLIGITGDANRVEHTQTSTSVQASARTDINGANNTSTITQGSSRNSATVQIAGNRNSSSVDQGTTTTGQNGNVASVVINATRTSSTVSQNSISGAEAVENQASVNLGNTLTNTTAGNPAQSSVINQGARGNSATVLIRGGVSSTDTADQNSSIVNQDNSRFTAASNTVGTPNNTNGNPVTGNRADVSLAGVAGNSSTITQDGLSNSATLSVNRGGVGATAAGGGTFNGLTFAGSRREGNEITTNQQGRNQTVNISVGGRDAANLNGRGNQLDITQGVTNAGGQTFGNGHSATVFQFGTLSRIDIDQGNNTTGATVQSASTADVSQSAFASTLSLTQIGTNTALLSQGGGSSDQGTPDNANGNGGTSGNNVLTVSQTDTGDTTAGSSDPFGGPTNVSQRNSAAVSQAGRFNTGTLTQVATNASATIFQRRGTSAATAEIVQGGNTGFGSSVVGGGATGGAALNVTASIDQGGTATARVRQDGESLTAAVSQAATNFASNVANNALVSQVGRNNDATVTQTNSRNSATVDQRFSNTGSLRNSVRITQTGGGTSNPNVAIAQQGTGVAAGTAGNTPAAGTAGTVGASGDADSRPNGLRSAEIVIMQTSAANLTGSNGANNAQVEQRAPGTFGRITQNGRNNNAGILQDVGSDNSVAVIEQQGDGNTFFITQNQPNSFFRVQQSGGTNQTVTSSGGTSTTGTIAPGFTATPTP